MKRIFRRDRPRALAVALCVWVCSCYSLGLAQAQNSVPAHTMSPGFPTVFTAESPRPDRIVDGLSITYHQLALPEGELEYAAACGNLRVTGQSNRGSAEVFFTAYSSRLPEEHAGPRPLVFAFNGGPGASSVWLHFSLGPRRVAFPGGAGPATPPYQLVDNPDTVLRFADIVFIDAVGTGFSQPRSLSGAKKYFGMEQDVDWSARFIAQYLTRFKLWGADTYLIGESYGAMRAVWLASELQINHGIDLRGISLLSFPVDLKMLFDLPGYDLPYVLRLPSFTAVAMHHGKVPEALSQDPEAALREVENWATSDYVLALMQGDRLTPQERRAIAQRLTRYTGLSTELILSHNLRITDEVFTQHLLRDRGESVGWMDGRFTIRGDYTFPTEDPAMAASTGPYVETWNRYVNDTLRYSTTQSYRFHETDVCRAWDWGALDQGPPTMYAAVRKALNRNPSLRMMVASGRHDLNTPYFATRYGVEHAGLGDDVAKRITYHVYAGGHQVYMAQPSLEQLSADLRRFMQSPRLSSTIETR